MRHRLKVKKFSRKTDPRRALQKSLAANLILNGKIRTTKDKAKFVRPLVEKSLTLAKDNSLVTKRKLQSLISNEEAEKKLISEIAKKYMDRSGGYTRVLKLGERKGDNALMVQVEFV
jgi:large subunit ribosomal protein L17